MAGSPEMEGSWTHFVETVYGAWLYGDAGGFGLGIIGNMSKGITRTLHRPGSMIPNDAAAWAA